MLPAERRMRNLANPNRTTGSTKEDDMSTATPTAPAPRLRITRRGRIVAGLLVTAPLVGALLFNAVSGTSAVASSEPSTTGFEYVTVMSGESLWEVAQFVAPETDPRIVISEIVALNQLSSDSVEAGARLAIPAKYDS